MAYFIALGLLSLAGIGASVWLIRSDGYRRIPTDPRRLPGGADAVASRAVTPPRAPSTSTTPVTVISGGPGRPAGSTLGRRQRDAARA